MAVLCNTTGSSLTSAGCPFIWYQSYEEEACRSSSHTGTKKAAVRLPQYQIDIPSIDCALYTVGHIRRWNPLLQSISPPRQSPNVHVNMASGPLSAKIKQVSWLKFTARRAFPKSQWHLRRLPITVTGSFRNLTEFPFHLCRELDLLCIYFCTKDSIGSPACQLFFNEILFKNPAKRL